MDDFSWLPQGYPVLTGWELLQSHLQNAIGLSGHGGAITPFMLYRAGVDAGVDPAYMAQQTLQLVRPDWFPGDAAMIQGSEPDLYGAVGRMSATWRQRFADWRAARPIAPISTAEIEYAASVTNIPLEERAARNEAEVQTYLAAQPQPLENPAFAPPAEQAGTTASEAVTCNRCELLNPAFQLPSSGMVGDPFPVLLAGGTGADGSGGAIRPVTAAPAAALDGGDVEVSVSWKTILLLLLFAFAIWYMS